MSNKVITLAITGASGAPYALRLLSCLLNSGVKVHLLVSNAGKVVLSTEADFPELKTHEQLCVALSDRFDSKNLLIHELNDWFSEPASGSALIDAMVVCPCSMGTLSAIANGASNSLLERAADVTLKESRQLIIVPRESPYSSIHLEHMLKLSKMGVNIIPASPGFYHKPTKIEDLIDFIVARILDQLQIPHELSKRWT